MSSCSTSAPETSRRDNWDQEQVRALITLWSDENIQAQLEGSGRNLAIYRRLAARLGRLCGPSHPERNAVSRQTKIKALVQAYKKCKDNNNRSGRGRQSFRYYDELDAILGTRPTTAPLNYVDTFALSVQGVHTSTIAKMTGLRYKDNGNWSTMRPSIDAVTTTFWTVYIIEAALPILVIFISAVCRKSLWAIVNFGRRNLNYDTQLLRRPEARTPCSRFFNISFWRHRPLPLEFLRICIEIATLLHILGYLGLVVLLSLWCIFDLVQGLHVLNLVYLRHTATARTSTRTATYILTMYSLLYGFPLGFISKLMWIVWLGKQLPFSTIFIPMYIEAVAALVFVLFFMLPNMCWRAGAKGCKSIMTRFQVMVLLLCFCAMWLLVYLNVTFCSAPPLGINIRVWSSKSFPCTIYSRSWTTSLLPVMILLIVSQFVLLWTTADSSMVYRFLPEIAFIWSGSLVFTTSIYSKDVGRGPVLGATGAAVLSSIIIAIGVNYILLTDILKGLKAPVILHSQSSSRASEVEVKRRMAMRESALKDYIHEGGKTMLKGTLLRHLKKRDRTKECVVCLESFKKTREIRREDTEVNEGDGKATEDLLGIIRKCGHYFHFNCVWDWIQRNNTCPLCRTNVQVNKSTIKTLHYDDVRYALERSTEQLSTVNTISEMVSKVSENSVKSRPIVTNTMFSRKGVVVPQEDSHQDEMNQPQRATCAAPPLPGTSSDASKIRVPTRSSTKHCAICTNKFQTDRQVMDIVVGYLRKCGHYFHYQCIDSYVREHEKCPTCQFLKDRQTKRAPGAGGVVPDLTATASGRCQADGVQQQHSGEARSRHGQVMREQQQQQPSGNPPPRGSRRHRADSRHQPGSRSHAPSGADLVSGRGGRGSRGGSSQGSENVPDIVQINAEEAGPSRSRNGYIRNQQKSTNQAIVRRLVHSEDILLAFLSDVQIDIKRSRGRKTPPSTVHVV